MQEFSHSLVEGVVDRMGSESDGHVGVAIDPPKLHRVFSPSLDPKKSWYALNFALCDCNPSRFCSLAYARVFPNEFRQVNLDHVYTESGAPASPSWFSDSGRRLEKVYVASAFGLTVGIIRQKSLADVKFLQSADFQALAAWVNNFDINKSNVSSLKSAPEVSPKEMSPKELHENGNSLLPTPPSTPSPPNLKSARAASLPPKLERNSKRTLAELRADEDLSPECKKRKIRGTAVQLMEEMGALCETKGESIGSVLGECCLLTKKVGKDARELFCNVMEKVVQEKGIKVAFSKLIPEEVWEEKLKSMRVPDWIFLLFKLKSRISDRSWQDLINLTKLGRTGVRFISVSKLSVIL